MADIIDNASQLEDLQRDAALSRYAPNLKQQSTLNASAL